MPGRLLRVSAAVLALLTFASVGCGARVDSPPTQPSIRELAEQLQRGDPDAKRLAARELAARSLQTEGARPALRSALASRDAVVRQYAALALSTASSDDKRTIEDLVPLQYDKVESVRETAIMALGLIRPAIHLAHEVFEPARTVVEEGKVLRPPVATWRKVDCPSTADDTERTGPCWILELRAAREEVTRIATVVPSRFVWQVGEAAPPAPTALFTWYTAASAAVAEARRDGKLVLVASTQTGCNLCEKFIRKIVPSVSGEVGSVAVGYVVDARTPDMPEVWQQLRTHLPRAGLMPLVGVFTPEWKYLTGFGGPPDDKKLRQTLRTALRMWPPGAAGSTALLTATQDGEDQPPAPPRLRDALPGGSGPVLGQVWCYVDAEPAAAGQAREWKHVSTCEASLDHLPTLDTDGSLHVTVVSEPARVILTEREEFLLVARLANVGGEPLPPSRAFLMLPDGLEAIGPSILPTPPLAVGDHVRIRFLLRAKEVGAHEVGVAVEERQLRAMATTQVLPCAMSLLVEGPGNVKRSDGGVVIITVRNEADQESDATSLEVTWFGAAGDRTETLTVPAVPPRGQWEKRLRLRPSGLGQAEVRVAWGEGAACDLPRGAVFVVGE